MDKLLPWSSWLVSGTVITPRVSRPGTRYYERAVYIRVHKSSWASCFHLKKKMWKSKTLLPAEMVRPLVKWRPFQVGLRAKSKEVSHRPKTERQTRGPSNYSPLNLMLSTWHTTGAPRVLDEADLMKPSKSNKWSTPVTKFSLKPSVTSHDPQKIWRCTHPTSHLASYISSYQAPRYF